MQRALAPFVTQYVREHGGEIASVAAVCSARKKRMQRIGVDMMMCFGGVEDACNRTGRLGRQLPHAVDNPCASEQTTLYCTVGWASLHFFRYSMSAAL